MDSATGEREVNPPALDDLQLRLERKAIDGQRLVRIPGDEPDGIPRVRVVLLDNEYSTYVGEDVSDTIASRVLSIEPMEAFIHPELIIGVLGQSEWAYGRSFVFQDDPAKPEGVERLESEEAPLLERFQERGFADLLRRRPVYAVVVGASVASACASSRENEYAAEAWVFTDPLHRRKGLGLKVVQAWARDVLASAKTAFYSMRDENAASWSVARSLGLKEWSRALVFK